MQDESEQPAESGNVVKTSVSLPIHLSDWLTELTKNKQFPSKSSAVVVALSEMKGHMETIEAAAKEAQAKKEQEIKLREAEEQLKKNQNEEKDIVTVILKLISNHPELLNEYNELRKKPTAEGVNYTRVKFE